MTALNINGKPIDLGEAVIATSYQLADVADLTSRKASYSNRFKIPKTPLNIKALGFAHLEKSSSDIPYSKPAAQLTDDGIELMPGARAYLESSGDDFNIELISGAKEFFEKLGDKTVEELVLDPSDDFNAGVSDGIFKRAVIATDADNEAASPTLPDIRKLTLSYEKLIKRIIEKNGYAWNGSIFSDPSFTGFHIYPLGVKGEYNKTFKDQASFEVKPSAVISCPSAYAKIPFPTVIKNAGGYFDTTNNWNIQKKRGTFTGDYYTQNVRMGLTIVGCTIPGMTIQIKIVNNGVTVAGPLTAGFSGSWPSRVELSVPAMLSGNDKTCYVEVRDPLGVGGTITVTTSESSFLGEATSTPSSSYAVSYGMLPENLKQKDLIREFAVRYGVLWNERNNILYGKTFKEIITNKKDARDWTNKRDANVKDAIKYDYSGKFAQNNYFKFSTENDNTNELTGFGNFNLTNNNLEARKDYYTSLFNSTYTRDWGNSSAGTIRCAYVAEGNEAGLRLLQVRARASAEPSITTAGTSYNVAYFVDELQTLTCAYSYFLNNFYSELRNSVDKAKLITRRYQLTRFDISILDLFLLVYDSGTYYLVNKIINHVPDKPVNVELLKIS